MRSGREVESRALAGHQGEVKAVCSLLCEEVVLSAGSDRKVMAWRLAPEG